MNETTKHLNDGIRIKSPARTIYAWENYQHDNPTPVRIRTRHRCRKNRKHASAVCRDYMCDCMGRGSCNIHHNKLSKKSVRMVGREFRLSDHRLAARAISRQLNHQVRNRL